MGIITTEGFSRGFLPSMGYGGTFDTPEPPVTERVPTGIQIPVPQTTTPEVEYTFDTTAFGHRDKDYSLLVNGYKELQKRYKQADFVILDTYQNVFKGFHEPGAEFRFSDLLAYYPFDGDSSECVLDKSDNDHHLTLLGSPLPEIIEGQSGNALFFGMSGDSKASYQGSLFPTNEGGFSSMSLSFWVAMAPIYDSLGDPVPRTVDALLFRQYTQDYFFDIHITTERRIRVTMYDTEWHSLVWFSETSLLSTSFFQHIVLTYRKAYQNEALELGYPILKLYVDTEEKPVSLYTADPDAPRSLSCDGDTVIGMESGCVIDEFRVHGHDLTQSEVITDFFYKARRLHIDTFKRTTSTFDAWTVVGYPYIKDDLYGIIPNGAELLTNHLIRSLVFSHKSRIYIDLTSVTTDGQASLYTRLRDGTAIISTKITVARSAGEISLSEIRITENNVDGKTGIAPTILPSVVVGLDTKEYVLTLWYERHNKNLVISVSMEEMAHPLPERTELTTLLTKTFCHSVRVTGDYSFATEYETVSDWEALLGLDHYEARCGGASAFVEYTPATITTD